MSGNLRTIRLYGKLGSKFGRVHRLAVNSAAEAVRALCVMVPGFENYLRHAPSDYIVFLGRENIGADDLALPFGKDDIRIAPIPAGAKQGGLFQVIVGVILIVAGVVTGGTSSAAGMALLAGGVAMAASGAMMMLSPQPKSDMTNMDGVNNRSSYAFNGAVNTVAQGNPVPLLYGRVITGSAVISGGIYNEERA